MNRTSILLASIWMTGAVRANLVLAQGPAPVTTASVAAAPTSTTRQTPSDIIESAAEHTLNAIRSNGDSYRKNPSKIRDLVDAYMLPHFDAEFAARLVLGKYWRSANHEQRTRFLAAFYHSLVTTYGSALVELTPDRLKVFPTAIDPSADKATVRTEVTGFKADRIVMNYSMHKTAAGWKVYDVSVDGISYIKSYREDYDAQIQQGGLDSLIARLEAGEKPRGISKTSDGKRE